MAQQRHAANVHEPHGLDLRRECCEHGLGLRPLQRKEGAIGERLHDAGIGQMGTQMSFVRRLVARVDHKQQAITLVCDHEVIEHAAGGVGEHRVALPARDKSEHVAGDQRLQRPQGVRAAAGARMQRNLSHVRHVEQTDGIASMQVLLDDAGRVLHRHVVAGEGNHASAEADMHAMQRRAFERRRLSLAVRHTVHRRSLPQGGFCLA